jgi:hypothetical protein
VVRILVEEDVDQMNGSLDAVGSDEDDLLDDGLSPKGADVGGEILASPTANLLMAGGKGSKNGLNGRAHARSGSGVATGRVVASAPPRLRADHHLPRSGSVLVEHILVAAGVKEAAASPTRASPRLAGVIDQHAMDKAMKRTAWKNLDTEGNNLSLCSFFDDTISFKICSLGVDLGSSPKQIKESVVLLKKLDLHHMVTQLYLCLDNSDSDNGQNEIVEDEDHDIENITLGHLCGDLMEEVMNEDSDHLSSDFQTVFKKNKSRFSSRKKGSPKVRIVKKHSNGAR